MAKKTNKKKRTPLGPNPQIARIACPLCKDDNAFLRLTHLRKAPYIRCLTCDMKIDGSYGISRYIMNLPRRHIEPIDGATIKSIRAKVSPLSILLEAHQLKVEQCTEEAMKNNTVILTPIMARVPCPICEQNFGIIRLTKKKGVPYLRCYNCQIRGFGILGVSAYLKRKRLFITYVAIEKKELWEIIEAKVEHKIITKKKAQEEKQNKVRR